MALGFNRKKAAESAPDVTPTAPTNAPLSTPPPTPTPQTEDLDEFDLGAFAAPATQTTSAAPVSDSAFDLPQTTSTSVNSGGAGATDPLDFDQLFEVEQRNAANAATNAQAPAPFVPPSAIIGEPPTPFYAPQTPVVIQDEPSKRKLPLLPILGTIAGLALAGGAAYYFAGQKPAEDESAPVITARPKTTAPNSAAPNSATVSNSVAVTQLPPSPGGIKRTSPIITAPVPGVAPRIATDVSPVSPGIAPASAQTAQMKGLWKRGADAKHRRDYAAARRYWNQGLKIQPNNAGFRDSIAKLPR